MKNISTNIIRDTGKNLDFIVTPNSKEIFERIFLEKGTKSFNLIGNYGTGKSTFLWACEKVLLEKSNLFGVDDFNDVKDDFEIIKILGEEESLLRLFAISFGLSGRINTRRVIEHLEKILSSNKKLVIFIDEFGKVLEYISKNGKTTDLYLLQQLAEWVNGYEDSVYLITTLHQNFTSYSEGTSSTQLREWEKVKGRYRDLVFNEPVEQLLFFASTELKKYKLPQAYEVDINGILSLVNSSKLVSYNTILSNNLIEELYPLDWLSANILVQALQKYGQNERSLFSFVNETSKISISKNSESIFSVPKVYDYIVNTLPTEINNPTNSHRVQWLTAFRALERAELFFEEDYFTASELIKMILLINLFSKTGGLLDESFLINYFKHVEKKDVKNVIDKLSKSGIIRFYSHSNKINFLEGTDIDIEQELIDAGKEITSSPNYSELLNTFSELDVIYAKRHSFETGTKRFFEYRILSSLNEINNNIEGVDGFLNIIINSVTEKEVLQISKLYPQNGFVLIKNPSRIESNIRKLLRYDTIIEKYSDDRNAMKLLLQEKQFALDILQLETSQKLFIESNEWIFNGKSEVINSAKDLYIKVSEICDFVYNKTPKYDNELINRNILSSPILIARKALINKLLNHGSDKNLNYSESKFPPDKAIYISLLRETGLHAIDKEQNFYRFYEPSKNSVFFDLWSDCNKFLSSALSKKKEISELYSKLSSPPYKLKKGFIDFFIPIYLIIKAEDYALFFRDNTFIPFLFTETLDLIHRKPEDFFIKAYNVEGLNINLLESYKELVGITGNKPTQSTFLSIYSNFLRFIRDLDKYTLRTNKISPSAKELRDAILNSSDPETALFNSIPVALGYGNILNEKNEEKLLSFTMDIQKAIKELRGAYSELTYRIENYLLKAFDIKTTEFVKYKNDIVSILSSIDQDELIPVQKIIYKRLTSALEDRDTYLKSIADAVIGYPVEELKDHDETILKDRLLEYGKALIKASDAQTFNKKNPGKKLIQFKFYNLDGSVEDEKVILNTSSENEKYVNKMNTILNGFKTETKKEILMQLYSKLKKMENE